MQKEKKTSIEDDVTIIFVKRSASKRNIRGRRHKYCGKNRSKYIKLLHQRLDSMNNTVEGQLFVKFNY